MERKEILEKKLEALEELESLEKKDKEESGDAKPDRYDLRSLTDPRELSGLRKLTMPRPFGFPGKMK